MKLRLRDKKVKIIKAEEITRVVKELCMEANYHLPKDMKDAILQVRKQAREEEIAAAAPKKPVSCPYCGAQTLPDEKGCCEYCRGLIN